MQSSDEAFGVGIPGQFSADAVDVRSGTGVVEGTLDPWASIYALREPHSLNGFHVAWQRTGPDRGDMRTIPGAEGQLLTVRSTQSHATPAQMPRIDRDITTRARAPVIRHSPPPNPPAAED
jgi:hypothetical protein